MTFRNLIKKALPFAVAALCSLVSLGAHEPSEPNESRPLMHDSLYDSWVAAAYNALPDNPDIDLCLDGFYAPVYFSNLRSNFGTNRFGTCAFVAMGMLLSFYDTYWDDSIVPSAYEMVATSAGDPVNGSIDSPGSCDSLPIIGNSNASYYLSTIVPNNDGEYLDMRLMTLASDYQVAFDTDTSETGLDYSGMYSLFQYYLYSYMSFSTSDIGFIAEPGAGTGQAKSDSVRDFAIEKVSEGIPVLLSVGTDHNSDTGRHAVIAYDYDEGNDLLYCHMGWGPKATHCTIESFGYTSYNSAFALAVRTQHSHSGKYRQVISGYCLSSHCACEFAAPYDIKTMDWYKNDEAGFEWSCLDEERWIGEFIEYHLGFAGYPLTNYLTSEKKWASNWWDRMNNQGTAFIYELPAVSVTISARFEDNNNNLLSLQNTATFPAITDFSGAHNIRPGDYGYSPNNPTQTGMTAHSVDGFSFKTSREGVYEDQDMVSLFYAGSGFNDAYIQYYDFPQGDTVIGLDLGIRLWEDTNAAHTFRIEYCDGNSWQVSADLLDSAYGISGSDGDIRWVHHSFGTPVSAFCIRASSTSPGFYDEGVVGLLTVAIYTVSQGKLPTSGSELPYLPCFWNEDTIIKNRSNCYRYAMNFPSFVDTQEYWFPGDFAQAYYTGATKEDLVNGALADSIAFINNSPYSNAYFAKIGRMDVCPTGCYKVALFIKNNLNGSHWFRQDEYGYWSQKDTTDPVTNLDDGGNCIVDPQFCETSYNYFCGYYCVGPWTNYGMPSN